MAFLLTKGNEKSKYGELRKVFAPQFYLGNDQLPKTIIKETNEISNNILDPKFYENNREKRSRENA